MSLDCSDGSCWATCLNATYYAQHLESVYGKSQSVIGGKLFSSYLTTFEPGQGLWDSKTSALNCSCEELCPERSIDHISR